MIKLEKMSAKQPELNLIAEWRNQSLIGLRSNDLTAMGISQERWVNSLSASEKYYFIYIPKNPNVNYKVLGWDKRAVEIKHFIGYCGLDKIDPINRTTEMGLLINPQYHKQGYGKEAVKQLLQMAFTDFNLNCVFIEVLMSTRNWDFWKKQGFKIEGILKERHFKNGKYYNSTVGSVTRTDWFKLSMKREK